MQTLRTYFFSDYRYKQQSLWFKRLLYLFLLTECIGFLCNYDVLFGRHSIVYVKPPHAGFFKGIAFLLYGSQSAELSRYFILAVILLSAAQLFTRRSWLLADILLWLLVVNLNYRIYPVLTGGDNLLNQLLFFGAFLSVRFPDTKSWRDELKICIHNLAFVALLVQVCLVYFISALAKLGDPEWLHGTAVLSVSQIRYFSLYSFCSDAEIVRPVFMLMNYLVLGYQLLFPVLVWVGKLKKALLVTGLLMHLYIAFVMGLTGFGFIMILTYSLFWPSRQQVP